MPIDMPRHDQVTRILRLLSLLEAHPRGLALADAHALLAEHTEISMRTLRRDMDALEQAGLGFWEGEPRTFRLDGRTAASHTLTLGASDLLALYLLQHNSRALAQASFGRELRQLFNKVDALYSVREREYMKELAQEIQIAPRETLVQEVDAEMLQVLRTAISEGHQVTGRYRSANGNTLSERVLGPKLLYFASGGVYLLAEDLKAKSDKVFALPRFETLARSNTPYDHSPIDGSNIFDNTFGVFQSKIAKVAHIEVRFSSPVSAFVTERMWHPSQKVKKHKDMSVTLQFEMPISPEFVQWVLGFGAAAQVIKPQSLLDQIVKEARAIVKASAA